MGAREGYNHEARECLWQSYIARQPAVFVSTGYTIEGMRYTWTLTVDRDGRVSAQRDLVQPVSLVCTKLEREPRDADPAQFVLSLSGCDREGAIVRIP